MCNIFLHEPNSKTRAYKIFQPEHVCINVWTHSKLINHFSFSQTILDCSTRNSYLKNGGWIFNLPLTILLKSFCVSNNEILIINVTFRTFFHSTLYIWWIWWKISARHLIIFLNLMYQCLEHLIDKNLFCYYAQTSIKNKI